MIDDLDYYSDDEDSEYSNDPNNLKSRSANELYCNRYLPYAGALDEEALKMFNKIKLNLSKAIALGDINPGVEIYSNKVISYLKLYGLKFSKDDHIILIQIYIQLIHLPDLEPSKLNLFCVILLKLLRIKCISPADLEIDWKPFYVLFNIYLHKTSTKGNFYQFFSSLQTNLQSVIQRCSIYFPRSSTAEIMSEVFPKLQPLDVGKSCQVFQILNLFLNFSNGYEIWFVDFLTLWNSYHNPTWSEDMMYIMGNLAFENIGTINWEPYLPVMFARILRWIDLPVSYKQIKLMKNQNFNVSIVAKWVVAVLGPKKTGQEHLSKFVKTIESYLHPANMGKWLKNLGQFLVALAEFFIKRLKIERFNKPYWKKDIEECEKLTENCITEFVECLKPAAFQMMYSRIDSNNVYKIFKLLSDLRPEIIIPGVIERVYNNLDSLTEPHRLTASFQCLVGVSRALVCGHNGYTSGKVNVIPILFAALPGIDSNDLRKAFLTMNFYGAFLFQIPIIDSSKIRTNQENLTEEEILICEQTADFESFILQFIDRILVMIQFTTQEHIRMEQTNNIDAKSKHDIVVEGTISSVLQVILGQCSEEILQSAARKINDFVQSNLLEPMAAAPLLGVLVHSVGRNGGAHIFKILVPFLTHRIHLYLNEHQDASGFEKQQDDFLYYFTIYHSLFKSDPREVINYLENSFYPIMDIVLKFKCQLTAKLSSGLLQSVVSNFSKLQVISVYKEYEMLKTGKHPIRQWGEKMKPNETLDWFIPGEKERNACKEIIYRYLPPILNEFDKFILGEIEMCREDICNNCNIIVSLISLCNFIPNWDEPLINLQDTVVDESADEICLGLGEKTIEMPDNGNIRLKVLETVFKLHDKIMNDSSDDIQTLKAIVSILHRVHMRKGNLSTYENELKSYYYIKKFQDYKLVKFKRSIKSVVAKRALIQQSCRDELSKPAFTNTHKKIMIRLLKLSTSHYSVVRSSAQSKLLQMIKIYQFSYRAIIDEVLEIMKQDPNENHESVKGLLYLLIGIGKTKLVIANDWFVIEKIWVNLLKCKPSEKPSIVRLLHTISYIISQEFTTLSIIQTIPEEIVSLALTMNSCEISSDDIEYGKKRLAKKNGYATEQYYGIIHSIICTAQSDMLHWRYHLLASTMINILVHPKVKYPVCVTKFFLQNLLNDSIKERNISVRVLNSILVQSKRKHMKIPINPFEIAGVPKCEEKLKFGLRDDNHWLQYNVELLPRNQEMWDRPIYIHKTNGYFGWSNNLTTYAANSLQPNINRSRAEMTEIEQEFFDFFSNDKKVDKYIEYMTLEENKGKEKFKESRFAFIKHIFTNFGDTFYGNFNSHLKRLISENSLESNHRCASEILSGILRGMKHWPFDKVENMYKNLTPLIKLALDNITVETDVFWGTCFATASEHVDPRKQYWLYEILIDDLLKESTSFTDCCRIFCLQGPFNQHVWRMDSFAHRLLAYLKPHLNHSFQNVRTRLGSILINIFEGDIQFEGGNPPLCPRIVDMISDVMQDLTPLQDVIDNSSIKADASEQSSLSIQKQAEYDKSVRLYKTICQWIVGIISRKSNGNEAVYFELLPFACRLESCEQDAELADTSKTFLAMLSQALTLPECMEYALIKIEEISFSKSWNARLAVVDFLQVLVFHNMAIASSKNEWRKLVQNLVLRLLEDTNIEVREKAAQVLGGLLHCAFLSEVDELLVHFKVKCKTKLVKRAATATMQTANGLQETISMRMRHAGILGLCSFISAYPYEIPEFLPLIFDQLAIHLNDPQPIPSTIRKTVGDFKRTHSDNWSIHKLKFTDDQLALLSDLIIPPTYYI